MKLVLLLVCCLMGASAPAHLQTVYANDNTVAGGHRSGSELHLSIEARLALWYPDGERGGSVPIQAFAEAGLHPQIPGPLIRVPVGTLVTVTVRNAIAGSVLRMHGLLDRPANVDRSAGIPFGTQRIIRFRAGAVGTYYYWGTTHAQRLNRRFGSDSQLNGAIVVDPAHSSAPKDRIFVVSDWINATEKDGGPNFAFELLSINGRTWPHTERLSYKTGDTVHWRWINLSAGDHPLHLHGYYFAVDSRGNGLADNGYSEPEKNHVVTELITPGSTFALTWHADRPGNWLFHCHLTYHTTGHLPIAVLNAGKNPKTDNPLVHKFSDAETGGLILAFAVHDKRSATIVQPPPLQRIHLSIRTAADDKPGAPSYRYVLDNNDPASGTAAIGPPMLLTRGVPAVIEVTNDLDEPTSVHWHGIELSDSYYDGVAGYSGEGHHLAPRIEPGQTFEARMTPVRAGTFIYHTHTDDVWQLRAGLAGPLIVLEPGERYNPDSDHVFTITTTHTDADLKILVNGLRAPAPVTWHAGVKQRLRFINVTTFWTRAVVSLSARNRTVAWRPMQVDGADIAAGLRTSGAAVSTITIGETRDFEFTPKAPGELQLQFWPDARVPNIVTVAVHVIK